MPDADRPACGSPTADLLIALGRDREAVEVATRDHGPSRDSGDGTATSGECMDGTQQLDQILPHIEAVVDRISPEQMDAPTPCAAFTVRGVLEHMIGGAGAFAPAFRGGPGPAAQADPGDVVAQWRAAMADLQDAMRTPGSGERVIAAPFGEVPGEVFARFVAFDGLVHGWDLATATGRPYAPADDLVEEVATFARSALAPALRDGDTFAAETEPPADAGPLERLVAFSGRTLPV